ncbi:MAG: dipeptidase [Candidatus Thorarchaeota archaeon]|jgi:membrane dipeptidase
MLYADAHSDLGILIHQVGAGRVQRDVLELYFTQMKQGVVPLSIVQIGGDFGQEELDYREYEIVSRSMNEVGKEISVNQPDFEIITKGSDLEESIKNDKKAFILSLEGSSSLDIEFKGLDALHQQGLRCLALTHNSANQFASGCQEKVDKGLTALGEELLDCAKEKQMIIDLVHIGERSFWDVLDSTQLPVFVSHSNSKRICNHFRNLTDEQISAIAERDGIVALNFISEFIDTEKATLDVLIDHADLMIELTSSKNVALGPDFYAYLNADWEYVENVDNPTELFRVSNKLGERGYSKKEIKSICYENLFRFIKRHLR